MPVTMTRPLARADQLDRGDEGLPEAVVDGGGERGDAAGLGLERAQRRFDERMALARLVAVSEVRFRHVRVGYQLS